MNVLFAIEMNYYYENGAFIYQIEVLLNLKMEAKKVGLDLEKKFVKKITVCFDFPYLFF